MEKKKVDRMSECKDMKRTRQDESAHEIVELICCHSACKTEVSDWLDLCLKNTKFKKRSKS